MDVGLVVPVHQRDPRAVPAPAARSASSVTPLYQNGGDALSLSMRGAWSQVSVGNDRQHRNLVVLDQFEDQPMGQGVAAADDVVVAEREREEWPR